MICPRCGTINAAGRTACTRCAGQLSPRPALADQPPPGIVPLTRRAELMMMGKAERTVPAQDGPAAAEGASPQDSGLYLLASERSTGQPEPPGAPARGPEPVREGTGQRSDRFVPRLSPAP